jgi:hypothetical protein
VKILRAYMATCAEFGIYFKVADTVAYAFNKDGKRLGYLMKEGTIAGYDRELHNAGNLLKSILKDRGLEADFSTPGIFQLRYKDKRLKTTYGIEAIGPGDFALQ